MLTVGQLTPVSRLLVLDVRLVHTPLLSVRVNPPEATATQTAAVGETARRVLRGPCGARIRGGDRCSGRADGETSRGGRTADACEVDIGKLRIPASAEVGGVQDGLIGACDVAFCSARTADSRQ